MKKGYKYILVNIKMHDFVQKSKKAKKIFSLNSLTSIFKPVPSSLAHLRVSF